MFKNNYFEEDQRATVSNIKVKLKMFSFQLFFHQKYSVRARDISLTYVTVTIKRRLNFVVMEN